MRWAVVVWSTTDRYWLAGQPFRAARLRAKLLTLQSDQKSKSLTIIWTIFIERMMRGCSNNNTFFHSKKWYSCQRQLFQRWETFIPALSPRISVQRASPHISIFNSSALCTIRWGSSKLVCNEI